MAGVPPTPYDPEASSTGDGSATSATKDIWDLDLGKYGSMNATLGQASHKGTGFSGYYKLPEADRVGSPAREAVPGRSGTLVPGYSGAERPTPGAGLAVQQSIKELMRGLAAMAYSPTGQEEYLKWQRLVFAAGFYGSTKAEDVAWGSFANSEDAFSKALISLAKVNEAGAPISFEEYLSKAAADKAKAAKEYGQGKTPAKDVRELTNTKVISGVLQQTAQSVLGRNLSKEEVEHFVSEYHANEVDYYRTVGPETTLSPTDETDALGTSNVQYAMSRPDLQASALEAVQEDHGAEAGGNQMADYLGVIESLLGGG